MSVRSLKGSVSGFEGRLVGRRRLSPDLKSSVSGFVFGLYYSGHAQPRYGVSSDPFRALVYGLF